MSNNSDECPPISQKFIEWLNHTYPERSPELNDSEREVWAKAGERRLVRGLNRIFEEQNDNILTEETLNVYESP